MKKITLMSLMFIGVSAMAQRVAPANDMFTAKGLHPVTLPKTSLNANAINAKAQQNLQAGFHYLLDWSGTKQSYNIAVNGADPGNFQAYTNVTFMDSTALSSDANGTGNVQDMRAGMVFDPKSPYYDPNQGGTPLLDNLTPYKIDTVLVNGFYKRNMNIDDTLLIEISWADTGLATAWTRVYYGNGAWLTAPKISASASHGNMSHLTAPNKYFLKHVLKAIDTVTVGVPDRYKYYVVVPIPADAVNVPAGNVVAVTCVYVPGGDYTQGAITWQYSGGAVPTSNGFAVALMGQKDLDYSISNQLSYWYDGVPNDPTGNPQKTKNGAMFQFPKGRYNAWTAADAWRNTCMSTNMDFCWNIAATISNQPVGINEKAANSLRIAQNMPNPFNDITYIRYELADNAYVTLDVYDITGKKVQGVDQGKQFAGNHIITFNGSNLEAGVYFYTLSAGETRVTKRMTVVK